MRPRTVLAIGGSDPSGGAGIQADIKAIQANGGYAMAAIACLTVQNTHGVLGVHPVDPLLVEAQVRAVLQDMPVDAVKIGMLGSPDTVNAVHRALAEWRGPLVLDPVGVAKGGRTLQDPATFVALRALAGMATLVTPNLDEAPFFPTGPRLLKGGHGLGEALTDVLYGADDRELARWEHPRVPSPHTHGTGCTLASAIATRLAHGDGVAEACGAAVAYVQQQIRGSAAGLGGGRGPLWQTATSFRTRDPRT
jgi:hydroxymethylpyrimidine/phosphomethylpyrimidine kinase